MYSDAVSMRAVTKFLYSSFEVYHSDVSWRASNFFLTVTVSLIAYITIGKRGPVISWNFINLLLVIINLTYKRIPKSLGQESVIEEPKVNDKHYQLWVINSHRKEERLSWSDDDEEKAESEEEKYVGEEEARREFSTDEDLLKLKKAEEKRSVSGIKIIKRS